MTMPTKSNCVHSPDGWCLECVGSLQAELAKEQALCAAHRVKQVEFLAELAALKQQKPVGYAFGKPSFIGNVVFDNKLASDFAPLYLAAGAQPPGYQLVPIEISPAMYKAFHKVDDAAWAGGSSNGANMSEIWEAMLAAAPVQAGAQPSTCTWTEDADGFYSTGCGEAYVFNDGAPSDNGAIYCHHCGKPVEVDKEQP